MHGQVMGNNCSISCQMHGLVIENSLASCQVHGQAMKNLPSKLSNTWSWHGQFTLAIVNALSGDGQFLHLVTH